MHDLTKFKNGLQQLDIEVNENQIQQFMTYYELLIEKNKVMNLTAITEFDEVIEKHFLDSLLISKCDTFKIMLTYKNIDVIDLGTGAGFPGIPLKIVYPQLNFILLDSLNKRIIFLNEVIKILKLDNITAIHSRAEDAGRNPEYREVFNLCVSRAVSNLVTLSEYCMPFVKPGGCFIPYKSENIDDELTQSRKAIKLLSGEVASCDHHIIPGTDIERSFVVIKKVTSINKRFPRKAGTPGKEPLI